DALPIFQINFHSLKPLQSIMGSCNFMHLYPLNVSFSLHTFNPYCISMFNTAFALAQESNTYSIPAGSITFTLYPYLECCSFSFSVNPYLEILSSLFSIFFLYESFSLLDNPEILCFIFNVSALSLT